MHLQMILKEIEIPKSVCLLARMDFDILENNHMVYTVIVKQNQCKTHTALVLKQKKIISSWDSMT